MTSEDALENLKNVHHKLMSLKWPDMSFLTIIPYELMTIIKDCESLNVEYNRRVSEWLLNLPSEKRSKELWQSRFLWAFGDLHMFSNTEKARSKSMVDEQRYRLYQMSWDAVCRALVAFLQRSIASAGSKKNLKGRPPLAKFLPAKGDELFDHISWNGKTANIQRNSYMSDLCRVMLTKDVGVHDKKEWQELYEALHGTPPDKGERWRLIDKVVRRIANAAKDASFGPVLAYSGGKRGTVARLM